jgi:hypothetical protein
MNLSMNYAIRRWMQNDLYMREWNFREDNSYRDIWNRCFVVKYSCRHIIFENNLIKTKTNLSQWCLEYAWNVIYSNYDVVISILRSIASYWHKIDETSLRTCDWSNNDLMHVLQTWLMRLACTMFEQFNYVTFVIEDHYFKVEIVDFIFEFILFFIKFN